MSTSQAMQDLSWLPRCPTLRERIGGLKPHNVRLLERLLALLGFRYFLEIRIAAHIALWPSYRPRLGAILHLNCEASGIRAFEYRRRNQNGRWSKDQRYELIPPRHRNAANPHGNQDDVRNHHEKGEEDGCLSSDSRKHATTRSRRQKENNRRKYQLRLWSRRQISGDHNV